MGRLGGEGVKSKICDRGVPCCRQEQWATMSTYACWKHLLGITRKESQNHSVMSDVYGTQMVQRLQEVIENSQRIYRKVRPQTIWSKVVTVWRHQTLTPLSFSPHTHTLILIVFSRHVQRENFRHSLNVCFRSQVKASKEMKTSRQGTELPYWLLKPLACSRGSLLPGTTVVMYIICNIMYEKKVLKMPQTYVVLHLLLISAHTADSRRQDVSSF